MVTNGLPKNDFLVYNRHMTYFIRKVKTKSGAIAVQIEHKQGRKRVGITHIGSAHNEAELEVLIALAHEKLNQGQLFFDFGEGTGPDICLEKSYSGLLWDVLEGVYQKQTLLPCQECSCLVSSVLWLLTL